VSLTPGIRLGPYEIVSPLGAGGMGEVYRATDTRLDRAVAIKVLPGELARDAAALARFEREAKAVAALSHPNILALHDFSTEGDLAYAVMELLEGETLRARLAGGAIAPRKAIEYGVQIARGLAAAHERGVIHRDLKPENLFVTRDERVKILDFGLAKRSVSAEAETMELDERTGPGTVLGTVGYMSPEQVRGEEVDARSDLFSFGIVLYEMLAGQRAFRGESAVETMSAILKEEPPELAATGRDLPPGLDRIVRHCLEKKREVRFQSARDLAFDLESVAELRSTGARAPLSEPAKKRSRLVAAGILVVALLAAVGAGWKLGHSATGPSTAIQFERLTVRRGVVTASRFAPDGKTFVYSAAWEGRRLGLFVGRAGAPDARSLGLEGATVFSVSPQSDLAVGLDWHVVVGYQGLGTLATVPLEGGAPRPLLEDVQSADWAPDGKQIAVSRFRDGAFQLEYPLGTVLAESSTGWISDVRVSRDGKRVAFVLHPNRGDNRGVVSWVEPGGEVKKVSDPLFLNGIAWSPDGREIWAAPDDGTVWSYDLSGNRRALTSLMGQIRIDDVAADGRALLVNSSTRRETVVHRPDTIAEQSLGWFDWAFLEFLSADGSTVLFNEQKIEAEGGYAIYMRRTDGSPPIRLGDGSGMALSPDGQWVLGLHDIFSPHPTLNLIPTGAGQPRKLSDDGNQYQAWGRFTPDGESIVLLGSRPGGDFQVFRRDLEGSAPTRQITRHGSRVSMFGIAISPAGDRVVLPERDGPIRIYPLDGSTPTVVPATTPHDEPLGWAPDGKTVYVADPRTMPLRIDRIDLASGARRFWKDVGPADPAGVSRLGPVFLSADGETIAVSFIRSLDEIYLATGLH